MTARLNRMARGQNPCWPRVLLLAISVFFIPEAQQLFAQEIKPLRTLEGNASRSARWLLRRTARSWPPEAGRTSLDRGFGASLQARYSYP
jgi:hypothetical protein